MNQNVEVVGAILEALFAPPRKRDVVSAVVVIGTVIGLAIYGLVAILT